MTDIKLMDEVYQHVMTSFTKTGQAPHFTELAKSFSVPTEEGKGLLHQMLATGVPGWVHPGTDLLASLGPFNNLPTMYRITVEGEQKWFAQ